MKTFTLSCIDSCCCVFVGEEPNPLERQWARLFTFRESRKLQSTGQTSSCFFHIIRAQGTLTGCCFMSTQSQSHLKDVIQAYVHGQVLYSITWDSVIVLMILLCAKCQVFVITIGFWHEFSERLRFGLVSRWILYCIWAGNSESNFVTLVLQNNDRCQKKTLALNLIKPADHWHIPHRWSNGCRHCFTWM